MSATGQQIIDRIGTLVLDVRHHKYTTVSKLLEVNNVIKDKFAGMMRPYSRTHSFNLQHGVSTYTYPVDFLHVGEMNFEGYKGTSEVLTYDRDHYSERMVYHNDVSNNEFRLDPVPDVEKYADSTTWYTDDLPDSANEGDTWLDRDGYILWCNTSHSQVEAELIVIIRPDSNLVLTAVAVGTSFINIAITRGGASGTASVVMTGTGTYDDPYLYTFTTYDNSNSNDAMIAALGVDPIITATGASSTTETTATELGATPMVNGNDAYWENFRIDVDYKADVTLFNNLTDQLHPSIKTPLDNGEAIAHFAAANILKRSKRPDYNKVQIFRNDAQDMMDTAKSLVERNRRKKPLRMTPGY